MEVADFESILAALSSWCCLSGLETVGSVDAFPSLALYCTQPFDIGVLIVRINSDRQVFSLTLGFQKDTDKHVFFILHGCAGVDGGQA